MGLQRKIGTGIQNQARQPFGISFWGPRSFGRELGPRAFGSAPFCHMDGAGSLKYGLLLLS